MNLNEIASRFAIKGEIESVSSLGDGFINDTYYVATSGTAPDYILQRKNGNIFKDVEGMMDNIVKVTAHIRGKVAARGGDISRQVLTVVPANDGAYCYKDGEGNYWAVSEFIAGTASVKDLDPEEMARKGGKGIGGFQRDLADFSLPLGETIPGFHDMRHRLNQWDESLARDSTGRKKLVGEEIGWIESRRDRMMEFKRMVEEGVIPVRVTHNDTKIDNILFDSDGDVLCVIDLDTVMKAPVGYDFGDAIRSYANTGKEDDEDLGNVEVSLPVFRAFAEGYLGECGGALTREEIDTLAFSALYITFEQVLRFLMDYIDGDTYYKVKSPDHNLIRARAQYKLLTSMESHFAEMRDSIDAIASVASSRK